MMLILSLSSIISLARTTPHSISPHSTDQKKMAAKPQMQSLPDIILISSLRDEPPGQRRWDRCDREAGIDPHYVIAALARLSGIEHTGGRRSGNNSLEP